MAWMSLWFSHGLGSTGLMLVLNDLKNLLQSNQFYHSVILNAVFSQSITYCIIHSALFFQENSSN